MCIKDDILIYTAMLDRVQNSLGTFKSVEEKAMLIKLLNRELKVLHGRAEDVDYWLAVVDRKLKEDPDWEDPRL